LENIEELVNVVIVDIDGVLNNYPDCFYDWVLMTHDRETMDEALQDRALYEELKDKYRSSGAKRTLWVNQRSCDALKMLKAKKIPIILLTDRPYMKIKRISYDTMAWLDSNSIPYDYLFWSHGQSKTHIAKKVKSVAFVVDDKVKTCEQFYQLGIKVYLFDPRGTYWNKQYPFTRIADMSEIPEVKGV
jgi:FMN phosphatase YigB (HAD superfamily)